MAANLDRSDIQDECTAGAVGRHFTITNVQVTAEYAEIKVEFISESQLQQVRLLASATDGDNECGGMECINKMTYGDADEICGLWAAHTSSEPNGRCESYRGMIAGCS